jgi:alkylation response protein AidB-like acyl-CoA dehydrogenase
MSEAAAEERPEDKAEERAESIRMIRDSAEAVAPRGGDLKRIRGLRFKPPGFDPAIWAQMGELGWIGLAVPEAAGGAGLGMSEFCALVEELGAGLVPEPLIPAALSATLLARSGAKPELLAQMLEGKALVLTAWQEAAGVLDAPGTPGAPRLFIPAASGATHFLVPVAENGRIALYLQPREGADLTLDQTQDGGEYGTLRPGGGERIAEDAGAALGLALDDAALATSAYLLGVMDRAFEMTLDYLKTRQQFGKIIGSFQVLQHRAADLKMQVALTRAGVASAAAVADAAPAPMARRAAIARAKHRASEGANLVTRQAIQLHGGIGYTDEHDIGLYLRKTMVMANQFGTAALHRRRFMAAAPESED